MEYSKLITKCRQTKFKFPRTFFNQANLSCGYTYYLQVERGEKIPPASLAAEILEALDCDVKSGLLAWARDQFDDEKYMSMFRPSLHQLRPPKRAQANTLAVNRMQAKLLRQSPLYWEVLTYMNSFCQVSSFKPEDISDTFHLSLPKANEILTKLFEFALVDRNEDGSYRTKEWLFIPYDEEFVDLRDENFERAYKRFLRQSHDKKFRTTHTRTVTETQRKIILEKVFSFLDEVTALEEMKENIVPFTIGIFASDRSFDPL